MRDSPNAPPDASAGVEGRTGTAATGWASIEGGISPLGAAWIDEARAFNFSLYSRHAERVTLLLFGEGDPAQPVVVFELDPRRNKTWDVWHCRVTEDDARGASHYAYSIDGPRVDGMNREDRFRPGEDSPGSLRRQRLLSAVIRPRPRSSAGLERRLGAAGELPRREPSFDWEDDRPPRHEPDAIIYEMHVRGFTKSPTSRVPPGLHGTFAGVVAKIPHLKELGVTLVELLPVHQFDPQDGNYWGYMTLNFFSPHHAYAVAEEDARREFKAMVKALHRAGIEVILDVVYNHTAEGDHHGPTYSFKGIDSATYYLASDDPERPFRDYSGCGNTLACHSACVSTLILESLRYWVTEMHVDGFRFDLASVLARNVDGTLGNADVLLLTAIRTDPILRSVHLIAEPWDAAGAYQLGTRFPRRPLAPVERAVSRRRPPVCSGGQRDRTGPDDAVVRQRRPLSRHHARRPPAIPEHQLRDLPRRVHALRPRLVQRPPQRGERPREHRRHGRQPELELRMGGGRRRARRSHGGAQAPSEEPYLFALPRQRIPMMSAGDELLHTQRGNNNPYNQDNETAWLDWDRLKTHADHFRFVRLMIAFRKAHPTLSRSRFWRDDVRWYGIGPSVDTGDDSHSLAYALRGASEEDRDLYVMINAYHEPLPFVIQEGGPGQWERVIDTALPSPDDIVHPARGPLVSSLAYRVQARSVVVLVRRADAG